MIFIPRDFFTCGELDGYDKLRLQRSRIARPWHFVISMFYCILLFTISLKKTHAVLLPIVAMVKHTDEAWKPFLRIDKRV